MSGTVKSDFVAAEEIKVILQGRDATEQERILRWVAESLGLKAVTAPKVTPLSLTEPAAAAEQRAEAREALPQQAAPGGSVDIKAFVGEKQPKSDMQFAAVVAYFHHFVAPDRREVVTKDDLQTAARLSNRERFRNPKQPLDNAVTNGYLDRVGRGEFRLNAVGENLVAMTLPGGNASSEAGGSRRKRRPSPKRRLKAK